MACGATVAALFPDAPGKILALVGAVACTVYVRSPTTRPRTAPYPYAYPSGTNARGVSD